MRILLCAGVIFSGCVTARPVRGAVVVHKAPPATLILSEERAPPAVEASMMFAALAVGHPLMAKRLERVESRTVPLEELSLRDPTELFMQECRVPDATRFRITELQLRRVPLKEQDIYVVSRFAAEVHSPSGVARCLSSGVGMVHEPAGLQPLLDLAARQCAAKISREAR